MSINHQTTGCDRVIRMSREFLSLKSPCRVQLIEDELRIDDWPTESRCYGCRRDFLRFPICSSDSPSITVIQAATMPDSEPFMSCSQQSEVLHAICSNNATGNSASCKDVNILAFFVMVDCYFQGVFFTLASMLIFIGTILNLFSLYCFWKMNKRHSTNVYLSVLSLADTINLHVNFTLPLARRWGLLDNAFRSSLSICRIAGVLTEFFLIFPPWIVVLLTMEPLIPLLWPSKRHFSYAQRRAKLSVAVLILIVFGLSVYRLYDLKGIDQVSVFSVVACNGSQEETVPAMRNFNLIIWSILPECFTLLLSLIIVYKIKVAKKHFNKADSKVSTAKYNQATKTVLLISILFLVFHTPTGILIALDLIYLNNEKTYGIVIILVSRKLTVLLYEISLCCKFFIYNQTFSDFRGILQTSLDRFIRRTDSAKLGRPAPGGNGNAGVNHQKFHFGPKRPSVHSLASLSDPLLRSTEETGPHHHHGDRRRRPVSTSRTRRDKYSLDVLMVKTTEGTLVSFTKTSDLSRKSNLDKNRPLWHGRTQLTL